MRRALGRSLLALACGVTLALATAPGPAAAANDGPAIGISYSPDGGDPDQCLGAFTGTQWRPSPDWTLPIRIDTDNRSGGCRLAFGVLDPSGLALAGLTMTYTWEVSPGGDAGQCGYQGQHNLPISRYADSAGSEFGSPIRIDTDGRSGYCNLTFAMFGRNDVALDVSYWADGNAGQCVQATGRGAYRTVHPGWPVTIGLDTDGRTGGCYLSLRLVRA